MSSVQTGSKLISTTPLLGTSHVGVSGLVYVTRRGMHRLRLLVRDICPLKEAGPVRSGRPAMHLYITHALYFEICTTIIQLMSIAGYEAYVCVCILMYKTVCAAFIWLPWDARSCPCVCLYCAKKCFIHKM